MKMLYRRLIYKLWRTVDNAEYAVRRHGSEDWSHPSLPPQELLREIERCQDRIHSRVLSL